MPEDEKEDRATPPVSDRISSFIEVVTLVAITLAVYAGLMYTAYWIIWGGRFEDIHARFVITLAEIDERWKVGLVVLLVLFYRPVRNFLLLLEQAWGLKTGPRTPREKETKTNPPQSD